MTTQGKPIATAKSSKAASSSKKNSLTESTKVSMMTVGGVMRQ